MSSSPYSDQLEKKIRSSLLRRMRRSFIDGKSAMNEKISPITAQLEAGMQEIREKKVRAIINRAEGLIHEALVSEPSIVSSMTQRLFRNIAEHTDVEITAHPHDVEQITTSLAHQGQAYTTVRKVTYLADEAFLRGSLLIKANKSIIDAQLSTQLKRAQAIIAQGLEDKG